MDTCEVEKVFGKFIYSMGCGPGGIANFFLKEGLPILLNLSLATGVFPDSWKIARVAPIIKSGQQNDHWD